MFIIWLVVLIVQYGFLRIDIDPLLWWLLLPFALSDFRNIMRKEEIKQK